MKNLLLILVIVFGLSLKAQPPVRFLTTFGGNGDDVGYSVKTTLDGNYIVVGSTSSYGNGNTDVYLVKLDSLGNPLWAKFYGGFGNEVGKSVIQLSDSSYVIAGFTNSYGAGGYDGYIIRVDKFGTLIWQRTFGGLDWDFANDLVAGSDGNIFVVGYTNSFGNGKRDGFLIKYDLAGNLLLQKTYGGVENEELASIINTNDNFLATVGYTESKGEINGDGYFLKLDLNGDTLFTRTFGGPYKDYACDLVQKSPIENDSYYLGGAKTYSVNTNTQSYMYLMSNNGTFLSEAAYTRNAGNEAYISVTNSYFKTYLTAFARSVKVGSKKMQEEIFVAYPSGFYYLINDAGALQDEYVYSIEGTKDGGYVSVGSTVSYTSLGLDVFFVKRDSTIINYTAITKIDEKPVSENFTALVLNNNIKIDFIDDHEKSIEIFDMKGSCIISTLTNEKSINLSILELQESIYVIRVRFKNGSSYSKKFMKTINY